MSVVLQHAEVDRELAWRQQSNVQKVLLPCRCYCCSCSIEVAVAVGDVVIVEKGVGLESAVSRSDPEAPLEKKMKKKS